MIEKDVWQVVELIQLLQKEYDNVCQRWMSSDGYKFHRFNLSKTRVYELVYDDGRRNLIDYALLYRSFLSQSGATALGEYLPSIGCEGRIKNVNSIEDKLASYMSRASRETGEPLHGRIPVKKCLNDLFGARCLLQNGVKLEEVIEDIRESFPSMKAILAKRDGGYRAIHIYFSKTNEFFQWELQIWEFGDESNNRASHKKYKQNYVQWETSSSEIERR